MVVTHGSSYPLRAPPSRVLGRVKTASWCICSRPIRCIPRAPHSVAYSSHHLKAPICGFKLACCFVSSGLCLVSLLFESIRSVSFHALPFRSLSFHVVPYRSASFCVIPCCSVSFCAISCRYTSFHVVSCRSFEDIFLGGGGEPVWLPTRGSWALPTTRFVLTRMAS